MSNTSCKHCGCLFSVVTEDLDFLDRLSPIIDGEKISIPAPSLCPGCRLQRRLAHRTWLYANRRTSPWSGASIFSGYPESVPFPVVDNSEWFGDSWDPFEFGRDFNPAESFFSQLENLRNEVPHRALVVVNAENSRYCNNSANLNDCYMVFSSVDSDNCMYGDALGNTRDSIDCVRVMVSELCYDCVDCVNCYNLQSSYGCNNCRDSFFLRQCVGCSNCFGCANLQHKEFYIFNEKCSRSDYFKYLEGLGLDSYKERKSIQREVQDFVSGSPRPHRSTKMVEDVSGNYLIECKNVFNSYFCRKGRDLRHCFGSTIDIADCMDLCSAAHSVELVYESLLIGLGIHRLAFCYSCVDGCTDLLYCAHCYGCSNCFGCVGLKKKEYCIFNKQYAKKDYGAEVKRIISRMRETGEWGEFYPMQFSPYPYNLSVASLYFPLSKDDVEKEGLKWEEWEHVGSTSSEPKPLPDRLPESNDSLVARSELSGRLYKIISEELKIYRRLGVPLPRQTFDERLLAHQRYLGGVHLTRKKCPKSGKSFETTYFEDDLCTLWHEDTYRNQFFS